MPQPVNPSQTQPNPAVPTRQQMVDNSVSGIFATVFNTDGTTSVRLVQVTDDGKLMVGGDASAMLQVMRSQVVDTATLALVELRVQTFILAQANGVTDDLERLRHDAFSEL